MPGEFNFSEFLKVNLTSEPITLTQGCFAWCQEQAVIFQSNLDIYNLTIVVIAMVALVLYNISIELSDEIIKLGINPDQLRFAGHTIVFFAFILLALFLGYYAWFN